MTPEKYFIEDLIFAEERELAAKRKNLSGEEV
jgi:hypothetical protein